ncbi:MAG: cell division protein SepF [Clostridia bacterium]|nr:cell division protein SepF [Clostridia bacterium]
MGSFINFKRKNDEYGDFVGDNEYYGDNGFDEAENEVAEEEGFTAAAPAPTPVEPAAFGATVSLKIVNPKSNKDAAEIADYLMNGNTVLLNIEGLAQDQAVRLLDYLAGATHAVGGLMTKVGRTTIVVAPKNVDVSSIEAMVSGN